jgi:hypothetical protein
MALNRTIEIGMTADSREFTREINLAIDSLTALDTAASKAQGSLSHTKLQSAGGGAGNGAGGGAGGGAADSDAMGGAGAVAARVGAQMGAIGPQIARALTMGMAPLTQIGVTVSGQVAQIGQMFAQLGARIDGALRMQGFKQSLASIQGLLTNAIGKGAAAAAGSLTPLQERILSIAKVANVAVTGLRGFSTVQSIFAGLRGSSEASAKSLQKLSAVKLSAPAAQAKALNSSLATMAPTVNRVATSVKGLGVQIGLALGIVGLAYKATEAIVGFFSAGIKGAIDLNETMNKVNETFGESASKVTDMGGELSSKFGLAKGPMLDAAASFGLIAKGAGMTKSAAADLSIQLTKLAVDSTSLNNIPLDESMEKIKSAISGESKPLRELGVLMNEGAMKSEAMRMGLSKGTAELSEEAKMAARASLIVKGLATASGDMERTQGDVANQFRKAGGGIGNFGTTIGSMLLPIVKTAVVSFNELLATLVTVFEDNKPMIQTWVDYVKSGFDTMAMILRNAGDYWEIFKLTTIQNVSNIMAYIEVMPTNLGRIADYIANNWSQLIWDGINAVGSYFKNLATNIGELANSIFQFFKDPTAGFQFKFTPLLEGFQATAAALPEMLQPELLKMDDQIAKAGERIANREAAYAKAHKAGPAAAPRPEAKKEVTPEKSEYKATAAVELGSAEAAGAIAKFYNQSNDSARQTAKNTKDTAKNTKDAAVALRDLAQQGGAARPQVMPIK